jgi:hypothetical protein
VRETQPAIGANPSKFQQLLRDRANEAWNKPLDDAIEKAKQKASEDFQRDKPQIQSAWSEQENPNTDENREENLLETPSANNGHRLENMRARRSNNILSLGITVWSQYSNDFIIMECSPTETVQTLLDKCIQQKKCKAPKFGANLALYSQTEFQKKLPTEKVPLAEFNFSQSGTIAPTGLDTPAATLAACGIKDGDGFHIHSNYWGQKR